MEKKYMWSRIFLHELSGKKSCVKTSIQFSRPRDHYFFSRYYTCNTYKVMICYQIYFVEINKLVCDSGISIKLLHNHNRDIMREHKKHNIDYILCT